MQHELPYYSPGAFVYDGEHTFTLDEFVERRRPARAPRRPARHDRTRAQPGLGDECDRPRAARAEAAMSDEESWREMARMPDLQALVERCGRRLAARLGERHPGYPEIQPEEWISG